MQSRIDARKASPEGRILFPLENEGDTYVVYSTPLLPCLFSFRTVTFTVDRYHFTLCNPPFYSSSAEITALAQEKSLPPSAVCTGAPVEMIYEPRKFSGSDESVEEGGEAGFVGQMVKESVLFGTRCRYVRTFTGNLCYHAELPLLSLCF